MTTWRRAVGTGAVCLGLLVAGSFLQDWLPGDDDDPAAEPHVRTGEVGDPVDLRTTTVTVDEVVGTTRIEELGGELVSPGLWVVAHLTVVPTEENASIGFAELRDDDERVWGLVGRNEITCDPSPPGLAAHCSVRFEVPPEAVPTLRLRLARLGSETRFDAVAEVDLGLTRADAEAFASAPTYSIPPATLGDDLPEADPEGLS